MGKLKESYLVSMVNDYLKRINKYHKLVIVEVKDENSLIKERDLLCHHFKDNEFRVALCIDGQKLSSVRFPWLIDNTFVSYSCLTFVIGGSLGLHDDVKNSCHMRLSFSDLTFPHGLFRAILLEQIYRSFKIINNESYHK